MIPYNETLTTEKLQVEVTIDIGGGRGGMKSKFIMELSQVCEVRYFKKVDPADEGVDRSFT